MKNESVRFFEICETLRVYEGVVKQLAENDKNVLNNRNHTFAPKQESLGPQKLGVPARNTSSSGPLSGPNEQQPGPTHILSHWPYRVIVSGDLFKRRRSRNRRRFIASRKARTPCRHAGPERTTSSVALLQNLGPGSKLPSGPLLF